MAKKKVEFTVSLFKHVQLNLTIPFQGIILVTNEKWLPENQALL